MAFVPDVTPAEHAAAVQAVIADFDAAVDKSNYDTTFTSRPEARPYWDDLTEYEQGRELADRLGEYL